MNKILKAPIAVEGPDPVDVHIGARMRGRRKQIEMSQEGLAQAIGVSFQQVQKYERGANRVSGSMLFYAGKALGVPVAYFYEGLGETDAPQADPQALFFAEPGAVKLADSFMRLPEVQRKAVVGLATTLDGGAAA
jgi:transcriptional regulator with XRE-family HTH domain